jgi:hypothetical protein
MLRSAIICVSGLLLITSLQAATKIHTIAFGKWQTIQWSDGVNEDKQVELKVRAMFVDGRLREYTIGQPHEVTERSFVVRRAFRINDALPGEPTGPAIWRWERGGWLTVDRLNGRITGISLPLMDASLPDASWYRDYVAYCGISDDGRKLYAMVAQLGRRKPLLHKYIGTAPGSDIPDSACPAPRWEKKPSRVTFSVPGTEKLVFAVRTRVLDTVDETGDEEE